MKLLLEKAAHVKGIVTRNIVDVEIMDLNALTIVDVMLVLMVKFNSQ